MSITLLSETDQVKSLYRHLVVVDNFYPDPDDVIERALTMNFVEPEDVSGWRTEAGFVVDNFLSLVQQKTNLTIKQFSLPRGTPQDNGVVFHTFSAGKRVDKPNVHWDEPMSHWIMIIYLSKNIPLNCGTSFFQHKRTQLTRVPTSADAKRLDQPLIDLRQQLLRDGCYKQRFVELARVDYRFNRAVIFPARYLHAATEHFGQNVQNGRLHQVFSFSAITA